MSIHASMKSMPALYRCHACQIFSVPGRGWRLLGWKPATRASEVVTNTISYGYDDDGEHRVDLVLRLEGGALVMEIADDGMGVRPVAGAYA